MGGVKLIGLPSLFLGFASLLARFGSMARAELAIVAGRLYGIVVSGRR